MIKSWKLGTFRFSVKEWAMMWVHEFFSIFLSPLHYHFGHYSWYIDLLTFGQETVDLFGIYILGIIVICWMFFYRNQLFQVFTVRFYKNLWAAINRSALFNYASSFLSSLKKSVLSLVDFFCSLFKDKKNKKK